MTLLNTTPAQIRRKSSHSTPSNKRNDPSKRNNHYLHLTKRLTRSAPRAIEEKAVSQTAPRPKFHTKPLNQLAPTRTPTLAKRNSHYPHLEKNLPEMALHARSKEKSRSRTATPPQIQRRTSHSTGGNETHP
ncbi:hypothetical protein KC19_1G217900 [Ceratodon purpureus]|uniref:Uncharacterized protein n=1 Tax=Ceratodon purpureus TaxID=3225 RepID=A0A8T0J8J9_CERPU|nr:hypothetical protein KC19_1G217900 [Ceratodon purpureus]